MITRVMAGNVVERSVALVLAIRAVSASEKQGGACVAPVANLVDVW